MALTRDFKQTVVERVQRDPAFGQALFDEALTLMLGGEPDAARLMLRELINSTVGFEALAAHTDKPAKSLHRMFSAKGNPSMNNLTAVVRALRDDLQLSVAVVSKPLPGAYSRAANHSRAVKERLRAKHVFESATFAAPAAPAPKRRTRSVA